MAEKQDIENKADTNDGADKNDDMQDSFAAAAGALGIEKGGKHDIGLESDHEAEVNKLKKEVEKSQDKVMRAMAELENTRRIAQRDIANAHKFALEKLAPQLLPIVDSIEQGLEVCGQDESMQSVREGMELTYKMFMDAFDKFGVEQVNPVGERFNTEWHEAMTMQEQEGAEPNTVIAVIQKGYILNGRLIRPARVIVAK